MPHLEEIQILLSKVMITFHHKGRSLQLVNMSEYMRNGTIRAEPLSMLDGGEHAVAVI